MQDTDESQILQKQRNRFQSVIVSTDREDIIKTMQYVNISDLNLTQNFLKVIESEYYEPYLNETLIERWGRKVGP